MCQAWFSCTVPELRIAHPSPHSHPVHPTQASSHFDPRKATSRARSRGGSLRRAGGLSGAPSQISGVLSSAPESCRLLRPRRTRVIDFYLFVDGVILLASRQMKANGEGPLEDEPPVNIVTADGHAALANGLQLACAVSSDDVCAAVVKLPREEC